MNPSISAQRVPWLDSLRVVACLLVVLCHCTDNYVPGDGVHTIDAGAGLFISGVRACVPLFVVISGALLLPMRGTAEEFLKRRFARIAVPFVIWGVVLALLPIPGAESSWAPSNILKEMVGAGHLPLRIYNVVMLPFNFTDTNIHFWFLYIIMGLYLFVPILSPWIQQATTRGLAVFLGVWVFTLFLPYLQQWPGHPVFPALHGECDWNTHEMTYYFGGYLGYFVLGHFLMRLPQPPAVRAFAISTAMVAAGWAATHLGLLSTVAHRATNKELEFFINFLSPNVALMTAGTFLICRAVTLPPPLEKLMTRLSVLSFGIFLVHYWVLTWVRDWLLVKQLPVMAPALAIPLMAGITFSISWGIAEVVSRLPGRKWLLG